VLLQSSRWPGSVILAQQLRPLITGTQTMASNAYKRTKYKVISSFEILHQVDRCVRQILKTESSLSQRWRRLESSGMLHTVDWYTVIDVSNIRVPYPQGLKMKALCSFKMLVTVHMQTVCNIPED